MTVLLLLGIVTAQAAVILLNSESKAGDRARAFIDALIARIRPEVEGSDPESPSKED